MRMLIPITLLWVLLCPPAFADTFGEMKPPEQSIAYKNQEINATFPWMNWSNVISLEAVEFEGSMWTRITRADDSWVITNDVRFIGIATQAYLVGTALIIQWTSETTLNAIYTGVWW